MRQNNSKYAGQLAERALAQRSGLSRSFVRKVLHGREDLQIAKLRKYCESQGLSLEFYIRPVPAGNPRYSVIGASLRLAEAAADWRTVLMDFVDELRRSGDPLLLALPPTPECHLWQKALFASTSLALCLELGLPSPLWARQSYFLSEPWFPAQSESLKAFAVLESPLCFRRNNIYVLNNFLSRV